MWYIIAKGVLLYKCAVTWQGQILHAFNHINLARSQAGNIDFCKGNCFEEAAAQAEPGLQPVAMCTM